MSKTGPKKRPILDRVLAKVEKLPDAPGCWLWTGQVTLAGYGRVAVNRLGIKSLVHRVIYEHFVGPIPQGMQVCHHCDVPCCCNPGHLFVGTAQDNSDDKRRKGRLKVGKAAWAYKHGRYSRYPEEAK